MPIDIPLSYTITSKLSSIGSQDIQLILRNIQHCWNESCAKRYMQRTNTPFVAIGISNTYELHRAIQSGVPVIHLERECKSMHSAESRRLARIQMSRMLQFVGIGCAWGGWTLSVLQKDACQQGMRSALHAITAAGLVVLTMQMMYSRRQDYTMVVRNSEHLLLRDTMLKSPLSVILQTLLPVCTIITTIVVTNKSIPKSMHSYLR